MDDLSLAPSDQLFAPLSGPAHWIPWLVLRAFALAAAAALALLRRLLGQKAELADLAMHDPLTGSVNRRALERAFSRHTFETRADLKVGILLIDLDYFKQVNDVHGHAAGDELLRRVAETVRETVRPSDVVARLGGDEFAVLLADVDEARAAEVAKRVVTTLEQVLLSTVEGIELRVRCSVGVALADKGDPIGRVLARADSALYEAKALGRNGWRSAISA